MADTQADTLRIPSARPEMTRAIIDKTDLDQGMLADLVHRFYGKFRADIVLGPIFASRITELEPHLERMVAFWSSVALMTGQCHGAPVPTHALLPVTRSHFDHWLSLFRGTAYDETCPPAGAAHVIERAERIARSLHMAVEDMVLTNLKTIPNLR
ncbi:MULTISPECIES: group III truncated hemoglobin [unclassified Sulfitobacter]|uniref:group III truncated hemoglobin n=1 Tax=unclassified Sulfitobacter TaxID=196795 RepID=UPI0020CC3FF5|nr:group III truncated hemoglobin [Sulfitobacter sp. HGT1]